MQIFLVIRENVEKKPCMRIFVLYLPTCLYKGLENELFSFQKKIGFLCFLHSASSPVPACSGEFLSQKNVEMISLILLKNDTLGLILKLSHAYHFEHTF